MKDLQSQSKTEVVSCDSDTNFQVACLDTDIAFFYIPVVYHLFAADFLFLEERRAHSDFTVFNGRYSHCGGRKISCEVNSGDLHLSPLLQTL